MLLGLSRTSPNLLPELLGMFPNLLSELSLRTFSLNIAEPQPVLCKVKEKVDILLILAWTFDFLRRSHREVSFRSCPSVFFAQMLKRGRADLAFPENRGIFAVGAEQAADSQGLIRSFSACFGEKLAGTW